jgi:hypothetical protein
MDRFLQELHTSALKVMRERMSPVLQDGASGRVKKPVESKNVG